MRYVVSPQFSTKLAALNPADVQHVSAFLHAVDSREKKELLTQLSPGVTLLGQEVYAWRSQRTTLYFTFGTDTDGEYLLLLDVTTEQKAEASRYLFAAKDPRNNSALNPNLNSSINPRLNSSLNPRFNSSINPKFNSSINPQFNSSINPKFNSSINPQFNSSINPRFNSSFNPKFNSSINPRVNWAFGGPYLYNIDLAQVGYVVKANNDVELLFDLLGNHIGELVKASEKVRVQFNAESDWNGYLVDANDDVALRYGTNGDWIGLCV
jgi:hypothetical protein